MITNYFLADLSNKEAINLSVQLIRDGNIIAFPTETVYGIGVDIYNIDAARNLFKIKNRSYNLSLGAYVNSVSMVNEICYDIPELFYTLAEKFLPGPLSVILNKSYQISNLITSGKDTILIRMPKNDFMLEVIKKFGKPLAGSSANISGQQSAINYLQVKNNFEGIIAAIIDGGECVYGIESTIISLIDTPPKIIRHGAISAEKLRTYIKNLKD